ncbi:MAG TPA: hypothetical protein VLC28_12865 [Flavitalea sp.]|nr:hypothetical protein [Flavitalea sp.]
MKKALVLMILATSLLCSCNNGGKSTSPTSDTIVKDSVPKPVPVIVTCYENKNGADTVQLRVTDSAGTINGSLDYRIEGKDANTGTFSGNWYGDTLIADYSFRSEGVRSVRQIAFLKKDSFLIEGFGPVVEEKKQMKFKFRDSLSFNQVNRLSLVPCK